MRTSKLSPRVLALVVGWANILALTVGVQMAAGFASSKSDEAAKAYAARAARIVAAAEANWRISSQRLRTGEERLVSPSAVAPAAVPAPAPAPPAAPPAASPPIAGKGMWIYQYGLASGGKAEAIIGWAKHEELTHLFVRLGSSRAGPHGLGDLAAILPAAHAAGIKVIAWDFPYLDNPQADVDRALMALRLDVGGHRIDGFAADVETKYEGTRLTGTRALYYATHLRAAAPGAYLILVPPRPNDFTLSFYPYHVLVPSFDAVAPMVYWGRYDPIRLVDESMAYFARYGKPVAPIGQAYDMGPEGGPKGHPAPAALQAFMIRSAQRGAIGVSFWSWQHASPHLWDTIKRTHWGS